VRNRAAPRGRRPSPSRTGTARGVPAPAGEGRLELLGEVRPHVEASRRRATPQNHLHGTTTPETPRRARSRRAHGPAIGRRRGRRKRPSRRTFDDTLVTGLDSACLVEQCETGNQATCVRRSHRSPPACVGEDSDDIGAPNARDAWHVTARKGKTALFEQRSVARRLRSKHERTRSLATVHVLVHHGEPGR